MAVAKKTEEKKTVKKAPAAKAEKPATVPTSSAPWAEISPPKKSWRRSGRRTRSTSAWMRTRHTGSAARKPAASICGTDRIKPGETGRMRTWKKSLRIMS